MMKPLSPKTLEKKYAELGLSEAKLRLLHTYFRCFSNLYGVISVREAWDVFKHYEGLSVHKKDFVAFSGVVQREAGLPYSVYELQEVFRDEESDIPQDRLIVNNDLVMTGYHRFIQIYATVERQEDKPHYLPEKSVFLSFVEDRFYLTPQGKDMASFVGNLRTGGTMRKHDKTPTGPLLDVYGKPVLGKRLSEFVFRTQMEAFEIEYFKDEHKKRKLEEEYTAVAADKLLKAQTDKPTFTLVEFHAGATSEKLALAYYLDGRVSALWGTHTHVPTADMQVFPKGTGYVTDLGMTGPIRSVLGIRPEQSVEFFLGGLPGRYRTAEGACKLQGAIFTLDSGTGLCVGVERIEVL